MRNFSQWMVRVAMDEGLQRGGFALYHSRRKFFTYCYVTGARAWTA
jgi:hypothetical protein